MRNDAHPYQISLFDSMDNRRALRERERRRLLHAYKHIISIENLLAAWEEFLRGKRNRKDIAAFSLHLMDNIVSLHRELAEKTYRHGPYHAFGINDPKPRNIHKAAVRDRLVHHALYRTLYPFFDCQFIHDSYSCRKDKGTHRAMHRFRQFARKVSRNDTRTVWVLKCDIRKFFANIDHGILMRMLEKHIKDEDTLWLSRQIIGSFHANGVTGVGLPLGNLTSQLFVNVYMNMFDQFVKREDQEQQPIRVLVRGVQTERAEEIIATYLRRWDIDNLYKQMKEKFGLEEVRLLSLKKVKNFLALIQLATSISNRAFAEMTEEAEEESTATFELATTFKAFCHRRCLTKNRFAFTSFLAEHAPTLRPREREGNPCQRSLLPRQEIRRLQRETAEMGVS